MTDKKDKILFYLINIVLFMGIVLFLSSVWIKDTYGSLNIAMADSGFLNGLENKHKLFLREVVFPSLLVVVPLWCCNFLCFRRFSCSIKRRIRIFEVMLSVLLIAAGGKCLQINEYVKRQNHLNRKQWYDENKVAIHALGEIDGYAYTNSAEALENNYNMGNRVFECDFILTSDDRVVACHDWNAGLQEGISEKNIPSKEKFMGLKIYGKYSPLSIDEIIKFMAEHADVYIVTDTKYSEDKYYELQFREIADIAKKNNCEAVLERFIIQIYHPYMHEDIEKIYPFNNYIYTLYQEGFRGNTGEMEDCAKFCVENGIDVITMNEEYYNDELLKICERYDLQLFVHTVNKIEQQKYFLEKNIGIYSDKYNW